MLKLFRNKEIKDQIILSLCVTAALVVVAAVFAGFLPALLVLCCGIIIIILNILYLKKRYDRLSETASEIDRVLHSTEDISISQSDEGELAILSSEVQKMTVALRDQARHLSNEKIRLTDAIADMFHQMRTPITSMQIQLSLLEAEDLSYEERLSLVRELKKQLERLHWLTETLLKLSRIDAGVAEFRKDRVSVRDLLDAACRPFVIPMELKDQNLVIKAGSETFTGDLSWTAEAVGNLVKNCMEHTPQGGTVSLEAEETPVFTRITVRDSGSGFDPADIPHLFERFYKGSNSSENSIGIGLALSRAIISSQNGTIAAENAPEGGAMFIIKFYKTVV